MINSSKLGQQAEQVAENYLVAQGYEILERNYFNKSGYRLGEIDLVAKDPAGKLIFVEVKARTQRSGQGNLTHGRNSEELPEWNLTRTKIRKIEKIAMSYLVQQDQLDADWRIEAVAVVFDFESRKLSIKHLKNIRL